MSDVFQIIRIQESGRLEEFDSEMWIDEWAVLTNRMLI